MKSKKLRKCGTKDNSLLMFSSSSIFAFLGPCDIFLCFPSPFSYIRTTNRHNKHHPPINPFILFPLRQSEYLPEKEHACIIVISDGVQPHSHSFALILFEYSPLRPLISIPLFFLCKDSLLASTTLFKISQSVGQFPGPYFILYLFCPCLSSHFFFGKV